MGYVELNLHWRWVQWIQMILMGMLAICLILFTRETRGSSLVSCLYPRRTIAATPDLILSLQDP